MGAIVDALRGAVRSLRSEKESLGGFERCLRAAAMTPMFAALLIILRVRAYFGREMDVTVTGATGERFRCHPPDLIQMYLWLFGIWEPDLTAYFRAELRPGDAFVDVGANIGYFTALAARHVHATGRVVAIEPSPIASRSLAETIALNDLGAIVRRVNKAVASRAMEVTLYSGPKHNTGLTTTARTSGFEHEAVVEALPLDELLTPEEMRSARVVKIDVEAAEDGVLAGIRRFLTECRADAEIFVELSPAWWSDQALRPLDVLQPFFDAGFHAYEIDNNYWPWRYLWPNRVRRPRRCTRDLTRRVRRIDLILSRADREEL
jgi:FkbM family methyltransferase